jgi:2-polyprenyl-3-methyl-5-hydroxy-6-metoxy-1,4-benzoquinol methylase
MGDSLDERTDQSADGEPLRDGGSIYGARYYAHGFGVPYEPNEHWDKFFGGIAERVAIELTPSTALDAGCAIGMLVAALRDRGVDAEGIDISDWAIEHVVEGARGHCALGSLTEELPHRYDLITCIEVIEHMPEADADRALASMCRATNQLLISSSPNDYGEATHVNVRPPEDWAARLAALGFYRDLDFDAGFITPWAALFRRRSDAAEPIRGYERTTNRLREEVRQLRAAAMAHQQQLEASYDGGEVERLRRQVEQLQEQILAERDHATVIEAHLGEASGRSRALESEILGYQVTARDFDRLTQLPFWPSLARYLRLRTAARSRVRGVLRRLGLKP